MFHVLNLLNNQTINLRGSLLGFEQLYHFQLSRVDEQSPFVYLQSLDEENIGFLAVSPFEFFQDFALTLSESDKKELNIDNPEQVLVLGLITMKEPFILSTINLLAPLVIHIEQQHGKQIILSEHYQAKTQLFAQQPLKESGE
ncbi:MAG: hypothetical protein A2189_04935 [Paenibacillus sp. RIFOXYA1_FULL_44_5]|nr:MAG: hypothetical protein A2189_04935 [Paenibacillus sp. RIFOXYA1_FULL_44_5]